MIKKILLPTDFSKNAWSAISYAIELFRNEDCEFHILNVFDKTADAIQKLAMERPGDKLLDLASENSKKELDKISKLLSFRDESLRHTFVYLSRYGDLIGTVKEVVEEVDIELVIMGTKGSSDVRSIAYGSNAIAAMEKIRNCPVLVVPPEIIFSDPREIVFPTNFKTYYKRRELHYMIEIAKLTNAPIRILRVVEDNDELDKTQKNNKELLKEYLDGLEYSFHIIYDVKFQTALHCFVQSRESGMVAFINKKHTFFDNLFSRPLVKDLGYKTRVPILAMHDLRD